MGGGGAGLMELWLQPTFNFLENEMFQDHRQQHMGPIWVHTSPLPQPPFNSSLPMVVILPFHPAQVLSGSSEALLRLCGEQLKTTTL